jgi:O-antigen/teichoic acid export membrane protein
MNYWNKIKKIYFSEFFKYSTTLLSSNVIGQLIAIAVYPIITRLYTPDAFGEFNWFLSVVGILMLLATGKYESAIVLPKVEKQAVALCQLSFLITCSCFLFFLIITIFWKENIAVFFHREQLVTFLPYLPFYLLLGGIYQILNCYFIRQKCYYNISFYNIMQNVFSSGLKCFMGFKGFLQQGLVIGQFWGQTLAVISSAVAGRSLFGQLKRWDRQEIKTVAEIYSNFPKYVLPSGLINTFANNLPVLLLSMYFNMEFIGIFTLALTIGFRPVNLFSTSVYQILFRRMSEHLQQHKLLKSECLLFCRMCLFFIFPFFLVFAFLPENFFMLLFGSEWNGVGFYFKCMLPWLFLTILVASLSFIPDLFFKQKMSMNIEIGYVILRIVSLLSGIYFHSFDLAIILYCGIATLVLSLKLMWYFQLIKKYELSLK